MKEINQGNLPAVTSTTALMCSRPFHIGWTTSGILVTIETPGTSERIYYQEDVEHGLHLLSPLRVFSLKLFEGSAACDGSRVGPCSLGREAASRYPGADDNSSLRQPFPPYI